MKAKDVHSIEERFVELLVMAPGDKSDKQAFFRSQIKATLPRSSYETMWGRLVDTIGIAGAGEAVFDYVVGLANNRTKELLVRSRDGSVGRLRARESAIVRLLFYGNGNLRPIGQRLLGYLDEEDWRWQSLTDVPFSKEEGAPIPAAMGSSESPTFEYDVALSFAGEQRAYVDRVARRLGELGVDFFYDSREETKLWGKDLTWFLDEVFRKKARYCVMFLSKEYVRKTWPKWEGQSALARAVEAHEEYILPVRLDDSEFLGLRPTIKYLDGRVYSPEMIAEHVKAKLAGISLSTDSANRPIRYAKESRSRFERMSQDAYAILAYGDMTNWMPFEAKPRRSDNEYFWRWWDQLPTIMNSLDYEDRVQLAWILDQEARGVRDRDEFRSRYNRLRSLARNKTLEYVSKRETKR